MYCKSNKNILTTVNKNIHGPYNKKSYIHNDLGLFIL